MPVYDHVPLKDNGWPDTQYIIWRRAKIRAVLGGIKEKSACKDCGGNFPAEAMDFDHVRGDKLFNMSNPPKWVKRDDIIAELAKCEVVCANCHRTRSKRRGKAKRWREASADKMAAHILRQLDKKSRQKHRAATQNPPPEAPVDELLDIPVELM